MGSMLAKDVVYAFRTFRRAPLAACTIVATVALGLGLITSAFAVYDAMFLSADAVVHPEEMFAVQTDGLPPFTRADLDALRREISVFIDAAAMLTPGVMRTDGRLARSTLVTGNFFQMLGVHAVQGRALLPADDDPFGSRAVIVLSHQGWRKLTGGDTKAIGRSVTINGAPYEIIGVMPDGFRGLGITPPDYWAPLSLAASFHSAGATRGDAVPVEIVGRLKTGMSVGEAAARLTLWASSRATATATSGRGATVTLTPRQGTPPSDALETLMSFAPIFFSFGLILLIGCANVANLLLARGIARQRELGVRLSLGASRWRVLRQLLTENLLLALAAATGGALLSRLILDGALYATIATMPPELAENMSLFNLTAPSPDWRVLAFLVISAFVAAMLFGLAPALQATRLDLVRTMRGDVTRYGRPTRVRQGLIGCQIGASALLLIGATIFLRGAYAAASADPGVRTDDTLTMSILNEERRSLLLQVLADDPAIMAVASWSRPARAVVQTAERSTDSPISLSVDHLAVSTDYFDVLGLKMIRGRAFTPSERTPATGVVILSESVARSLWPNGDPVGRVIRLSDPGRGPDERRQSRTATVVGVAREAGGELRASYLFTFQGVYVPSGPESPGTSLLLRVRGNPEQTRDVLYDRLKTVDPGFVGITTVKAVAAVQFYVLRIAFWVTVVLGGLGLALTVSGLFSVLSYIVERQSKDIGVRIALGATTRHVAPLVLLESLRPAAIGLAVGTGMATALAIVLMATPAAAEVVAWVRVFDPMAYAVSLLVIIMSCVLAVTVPTLRAARIDPIATLRRD